jgi:hypothetical protein
MALRLANGATKGKIYFEVVGGHVKLLITNELMKVIWPQVQESTPHCPQKVLTLFHNLN